MSLSDTDDLGRIDVSFEPFSVRLRRPVATARGVVFERNGWVVVARTGSHWGRGEVAPLPGWSSIDVYGARAQLSSWTRSSRSGRPAEVDGLAAEVRAGIGAALFCLRAAAQGVPLWRFLGAESGEVLVNHLVVGSTPQSLADHAAATIAGGATVVKAKLGFRDDRARVRALAAVIPASVRVRLDANGAWSADEAASMGHEVLGLFGDSLEYIEDPMPALGELAEFRRRCPVPVAIDESVRDLVDLEAVVSGGLADVVVVKPPLVGGIGPTLTLARACAAAGIDVVVSSSYDGPVGLAVWCHLASALPGDRAHGLGTAGLLDGDAAAHLVPRGDRIVLPG